MQLTQDILDARTIRADGIEIIPTLPYWIRVMAPSKKAALQFAQTHRRTLDRWCQRYLVYLGYGKQLIKIGNNKMANSELIRLSIGGGMAPTLPIIRIMEMMLTDRDTSYGLVRLSDERQIVLNGGAGGQFLVGAEIKEATQWKRSSYWHSQDLRQFNVDWPKAMEANGEQWTEYRYRVFDPKARLKGDSYCTHEMVSAYKLIDDGLGNLYHLAKNVDMIALSR